MRLAVLLLVGCASTTSRPTQPSLIHTTVRAAPARTEVAPSVQVVARGAFLSIADVTIRPTGVCRPYEPMLIVDAVVHNHGSDFVGSPGYGLVGAHRDTFGSMIGNGGFVPALPGQQSVRVSFPIFFPVHDPESAQRASRWEVGLDVYDRFPREMSKKIRVRDVPRPCDRRVIAQ